MRNDLLLQAGQIRQSMNVAADTLTDQQAAQAKDIFLLWQEDVQYAIDDRRRYKNEKGEMTLYKCRQAHTSQKHYPPYLIPAIWQVIDETHAGTVDDPVPAQRGMQYTYGLYYLDPEDGKIYLCKRADATGDVVLQYLPHELVGQYFEEVRA